jgi:hypothetical protein
MGGRVRPHVSSPKLLSEFRKYFLTKGLHKMCLGESNFGQRHSALHGSQGLSYNRLMHNITQSWG